MTIDAFKPARVDPEHGEDWENLMRAWDQAGKPRHFGHSGVYWMQIKDNQGICFVPEMPEGGISSFYEQSSFKGINK